MTFYQELQLNQAGSKRMIKNSENRKEKLYHTAVYLAKIAVTMAFCFVYVAGCSVLFGNDNSVVGVVSLLCLMVFKNADFGVDIKESIGLLGLFFAIMAVGPHVANQMGPVMGMGINILALSAIMLLGCHNPLMSNQSTIVLGYLLLYGYDVTGESYRLRVMGLLAGCVLTMIVFYRNHAHRSYKRKIRDLIAEFRMDSLRSRWQICLVLCVSAVICISEIFRIPRAMWAGIAAMSAIVPFMSDMKVRVRERIIGNIVGGIAFLLLYFSLPESIYAYIGIIGGIGVGLSVKYGWQAVFNTFGALAIAAEAYGLAEAIQLRVIQNVFGVLFALGFCFLFNLVMNNLIHEEHNCYGK